MLYNILFNATFLLFSAVSAGHSGRPVQHYDGDLREGHLRHPGVQRLGEYVFNPQCQCEIALTMK